MLGWHKVGSQGWVAGTGDTRAGAVCGVSTHRAQRVDLPITLAVVSRDLVYGELVEGDVARRR